MKTLREILTEKCVQEGWATDDENLEEVLRECYPAVYEEELSQHRWRVDYKVVAKIEDGNIERFFSFTSYGNSGDLDAEGCGYEFEGIDNVVEVEPYQETVTKYKAIN
jgi:hypothetical protein